MFQYSSQQEYVNKVKAEVLAGGGEADDLRFRLPIIATSTSKRVYTPDLAVAWNPPVKDSTVTKAWTSSSPSQRTPYPNTDAKWGLRFGVIP